MCIHYGYMGETQGKMNNSSGGFSIKYHLNRERGRKMEASQGRVNDF